MRLDEAPGGGALFQVYLPELEQDQDYSPGREPPSQPAGHERVMFVDDEPALADIGQHILSRLGYQVRVYTSSREALAQFKKTPEAFDLIISDQTMPGLTGSALAQEVKAVRPPGAGDHLHRLQPPAQPGAGRGDRAWPPLS